MEYSENFSVFDREDKSHDKFNTNKLKNNPILAVRSKGSDEFEIEDDTDSN